MKLKQILTSLPIVVPVSVAAMLLLAVVVVTPVAAAECEGVKTAVIQCDPVADDENAGILALLVIVLKIMTAGVGIVAVGGLIYGGILYASAGPNAGKVQKAIEVIQNVVIGIVAYLLMFGFLNFLIPGGVFK